jgi:hypothetical protein
MLGFGVLLVCCTVLVKLVRLAAIRARLRNSVVLQLVVSEVLLVAELF